MRLRGILLAAVVAAAVAAQPRYFLQTIAGSDRAGDGGPALAGQLSAAKGLASDRAGNVYISDTDNHRIRRIAPDGTITTIAGNGRAGFYGDDGPADLSQLNTPFGLATDASGNLYVADLGNNRVRKVSASGQITTVAGTGEKGSQGDGRPALSAQLSAPRNVAADAGGNLYISEFEGHRVRKVAPDGRITTYAGTGVAGYGGDGGQAIMAQLAFPAGLALDFGGNLYIADSDNRMIRRVSPAGVILSAVTWRGGVNLTMPVDLAVDWQGLIYVAERGMPLRRFLPGGRWETVAGPETPAFDEESKPLKLTQLDPAALALTASGELYFADGLRIRKLSRGVVNTVAGHAFLRHIGDGLAATLAQLRRPAGLALDLAGNLYIADTETHRIRKVSPEGVISTLAGTGRTDPQPLAATSMAATVNLNRPHGVAVDPDGNVLVADSYNDRIREISAGGLIRIVAGSSDPWGLGTDGAPALLMPLRGPLGAHVSQRRQVYIIDTANHRVLLRTAAGTLVTVAGNGASGFGGDGGPGKGSLLQLPSAAASDNDGNLYIADALNHRIRKLSAGGIIQTVAGSGEPGFSGDGGAAPAARLNHPRGVAVDGDGNLYIADTENHRIRRVGRDGIIATIAGTGQAGFNADSGPALETQLNAPFAVLADGAGNLYVSDMHNHRVRKLSPGPEATPVEPVEQPRVIHAATLREGPVAPGQLVLIFARLGPGALPADTSVVFDDLPATVLHVNDNQIQAQAPLGLATRPAAVLEVRHGGSVRSRRQVAVAAAAPGIFTVSGGTGTAAALNQDGTPNTEANAAAPGSVVTFFATGEGPGTAITVRIARAPAEILYAGPAPGFLGLLQVNARIPPAFMPTGAVELEMEAGGTRSQAGVSLWLR